MKQKGKTFITELRDLCIKYKISFGDLQKIVKQLKVGGFPLSIIEKNNGVEEEDGRSFWGDAAKVVKKVMKKKIF